MKWLSSVVFDQNDPEYYHWIALVSIAYVYNLLVCFFNKYQKPLGWGFLFMAASI